MFPIRTDKETLTLPPALVLLFTALNLAAFVLFNSANSRYVAESDLANVQAHIFVLKARTPDLVVHPFVQQAIDQFRRDDPQAWVELARNNRPAADSWEAATVYAPDATPQKLQAEMKRLDEQYLSIQTSSESPLWRYGFHSLWPTLQSFVTYQFLHPSWLHIAVSFVALWICIIALEGAWPPLALVGLYLASGIFAACVHALTTPRSALPVIGSSGALCGLLGAMLAVVPAHKLRFGYFSVAQIKDGSRYVVRPAIGLFSVPVYAISVLLLLGELALTFTSGGSVARSAPLAGLGFGLVIGLTATAWNRLLASRRPRIEDLGTLDVSIKHASQMMARSQPAKCIAELRAYLRAHPDSLPGWQLLLRAQEAVQDYTAMRDYTLPALVRLCSAAGDNTQALRYVERYRNLGGELLAPNLWLELCQKYEREHFFEAAANEYEALGKHFYSSHEVGVAALVGAARIYFAELYLPAEAERLYVMAQNSPVPHAAMEPEIHNGIMQCRIAGISPIYDLPSLS